MVTFTIGITLVPERINMARTLRAELQRQDPNIIIDFYTDLSRSGVWNNTEKAWLGYDHKSTHRIILQEDTYPCPNFINHVSSAIEAKPDDVLSLYGAIAEKAHFDKALHQNKHWYSFTEGMTGQGVVLPTVYISAFLRWTELHISRASHKNCDNRLNAWAIAHHKRIWQTVPELIRHVGGENSTLGYNSPTKHEYIIAGNESIDWTLGSKDIDAIFYDTHYPYFEKWLRKYYHD